MNSNKNATRKLIDFKRGQLCIYPSSKPYWKAELNVKYLNRQNAGEIREKYGQKVLDLKQL